MTHAEQDMAILDTLVPRLKAEGYDVVIRPPAQMLPSFMDRYQPDAIAIKADRRLAIEVVRDGVASKSNLEAIRRLFDEKSDWELLVYWLSDLTVDPDIRRPDAHAIAASLQQVERVIEEGFYVSGLLQGWATFEAAARSLFPEPLSRPQSSSHLLEVLASTGSVTPDEADKLRALSLIRNAVAHGDLGVDVSAERVRELVTITRTMISEDLLNP